MCADSTQTLIENIYFQINGNQLAEAEIQDESNLIHNEHVWNHPTNKTRHILCLPVYKTL